MTIRRNDPPQVVAEGSAPQWAHALTIDINGSLNNLHGTTTSLNTRLGSTATTVALLPPASTSRGYRSVVTDSTAALTAGIGAVVAGGGANIVPVFCDGTNWRIG